jgi:hypothetical protein
MNQGNAVENVCGYVGMCMSLCLYVGVDVYECVGGYVGGV